MKKVLLLGDSIRIGYEPAVRSKLADLAEVVGPADNCRFAKYTLWYVDHWLETLGKPDVIHWNNGIWDVYHLSEEQGVFTTLEEYIHTMGKILNRLQRTGAPIIWATTTAVNPANQHCSNEEIDRYNAAIVELMHANSIAVNDLNSVVKAQLDDFIDVDLLHLTPQGSEACADAVAASVKRYL